MKKAIKAAFGAMFVMLAVGCGQENAVAVGSDTILTEPAVTSVGIAQQAYAAPKMSCLDLMNEVATVPPGTSCTCQSGSIATCGNTTTNCASSSLDTACCMHSSGC